MTINETISEVLRLDEEPEESAWDLIEQHAYYRTAAPALAREVQSLQGEVDRLLDARTIDRLQAHGDGYQDGHRAGQEAMRERCMEVCSDLILRARVCAGDDEGLRDLRCLESHLLRDIRALEVE